MIKPAEKIIGGRSVPDAGLLVALLLCLLFSQISISIEQSFLAFGLIFWVILLVTKKRGFAVPAFFWPLALYSGLSLASAAASVNPGVSFKDSREILLYLLVPMAIAAFKRQGDARLALGAVLVSGLVNSLSSIGYALLAAAPGERVKGFMGHYMTQSGLLVVTSAVALAMIVFGRGKMRALWAAGFLLSSLALVLTLTRSGWIGLAVALCLILLFWKPKVLVLVPVLAGLALVASPRTIRDRALSIFSAHDLSNRARIEYAKAGLRIIGDYPWLGTGPDTVDVIFQDPKYGLTEITKRNVHLHSNVVQIAAERGIVTLLAWLAFIVVAFGGLIKLARGRDAAPRAAAIGALAGLAAFVTAGFMEYNFGDSEVVTLMLFLITIPFAMTSRLRSRTQADSQSAVLR